MKLRLEPAGAACSLEESRVRMVLAPSALVIAPPQGATVRLDAGGRAEVKRGPVTSLYALAYAYRSIAVRAPASTSGARLVDLVSLVIVDRYRP